MSKECTESNKNDNESKDKNIVTREKKLCLIYLNSQN